MLNGTSDKKIDEGSFKIFFTDGSSEPQYGFFGAFFPGDSKERSYTWEYLKSKTPMDISYNAGFFSNSPSALKLNWAPPGQSCNLVSPAAKAAADKAAAEKVAAAIDAANKSTDAANAKADAANKAAELAAQIAALNAKIEAEKVAAANLALKSSKSAKASTITCIKGKLIKKVTAVNPVCPSGYKQK